MTRQLTNAAGLDRYWLPKYTAFGISPDQFGPRGFGWKVSHTVIRPTSGHAKLVIYLRLGIGAEGNVDVSIDSVGHG